MNEAGPITDLAAYEDAIRTAVQKRSFSQRIQKFVDFYLADGERGSLVPRTCAFVACSTKFAQRAWARSSRDACRSLRHKPSTGINDVIDELAPCLPLKEALEITVMVRVRTYQSLGSARAQAAVLSWIVDVYIQIPWPHRVTRSNLDFGSSSSSA